MSTHKNFVHGNLQLAIPTQWQDASTLTFAGKPFEGFRPNVVVTSRPSGKVQDIRKWAEKDKEQIQASLPPEASLLSHTLIDIDGAPAVASEIRQPVPEQGNLVVVHWQVTRLLQPTAYSFTFTAHEGDFENQKPVFEKIVNESVLT